MWKKISPLIKATCTIIFCTTALTLALAKTDTAGKSEKQLDAVFPLAKIASGHEFSFRIAGAQHSPNNLNNNNTNTWMQNLPVSWHSYLLPIAQNHYDKP